MNLMLEALSALAFFALFTLSNAGTFLQSDTVCTVIPGGGGIDDSEAILQAFNQCGQGGQIIFLNETYHIERVMNTTGLNNVQIDLHGTLLWGTNISYWLANSLPVGYQNQSSAWFLGGNNITFRGFNQGTFDGNGQVWYDFVKGASNLAGRPHALTIWKTQDSVFDGIRFVQSQMWTMTVAWSENVLLESIYVNSTSSDSEPTQNTDGADTLASNNITFRNWVIDNGDDSIAIKANSTNILIQDMVLYRGLSIAIGSIGQYKGIFEFVNNVVAENVTCIGTRYMGYIKTWTGIQQGFPPNGGGGGTGLVSNIVWRNFTLNGVYQQPVQVTQCTSFSGAVGGCDTSTLEIANVTWGPATGNITSDLVAEIQCSAAAPCEGVTIQDLDIDFVGAAAKYECSNVQGAKGFNCTGGV